MLESHLLEDDRRMSTLENRDVRVQSGWKGVVLGQGLSILLAGTGAFSQLLARQNLSAPAFQNLLAYLVLCMVYGLQWSRKKKEKTHAQVALDECDAAHIDLEEQEETDHSIQLETERDEEDEEGYDDERHRIVHASWRNLFGRLHMPVYLYMLVSVCDVLGNFLAVLAYRFTNVTSVTLLDCFAIPVVMILSKILFGTLFGKSNLIGVIVCVGGLVIVVISDVDAVKEDVPNAVLGDVLAIGAAFFYGCSNVAQEAVVKTFDRIEFLFMLGVWGAVFSCVLVVFTEWSHLQAAVDAWKDGSTYVYLGGYAACLAGMYAGISGFLILFDATLLNLSLLSSDVWAVVLGIALFREHLSWVYFVGLSLIMSGVALYNTSFPKSTPMFKIDAGTAASERNLAEGLRESGEQDVDQLATT